MDATELRYVDYDAEATWQEMMETYVAAGGDVLYPGDEKEILLRAVLAIATAIMARVDSALKMDTLTYATGEYLKEYGRKRNCEYIEAVAATAKATITFRATGVAGALSAGTEMTEDGQMIWTLDEDIEITGTAQEVEAGITCLTAGAAGNSLAAGAQLQLLETSDAVVSAIVTEAASGGVDAEDEEVYRERIRNYGLASVTTGPAQQYEGQAMAVSSQIIDARAVNDGDGEVGVYLILADGADEEVIIPMVEERLSAETSRPLTDAVTVSVAEAEEYTLNVKVWYSQYAGIGGDVTQALADYKTWQDNRIGRAWNPDKLTAMLYQAGCERVQYLEGSGMDGSVEYTEIGERNHCKGTITLTVVNT